MNECGSTFRGFVCAEEIGEHAVDGMHQTDPNRRYHVEWPDDLSGSPVWTAQITSAQTGAA